MDLNKEKKTFTSILSVCVYTFLISEHQQGLD